MSALRLLSFSIALLAVVGLASADERAPVPAGPDLEKAQGTIREVFKAEFAKTKAADRLALATKLFQQAAETKGDPAAKFALLRDARDLAAKASDAFGVLRASEEMTAGFALKPGEAIAAALDPLVASTNSAATAKQIAEVLLLAADEARFAGDWAGASAILKAAGAAAGKANAGAIVERVRVKVKDVEAGRTEFEKAKEAFDTIQTRPGDAAASLVAGRYLAFVQQEWTAGIALLAKGSDEKLQGAAQRDLKAATGTDDERIAAADGWYDLAANAETVLKPGMQIRAHHWYVEAFAGQGGLNKARVEKRIAELQPVVDAKADHTALWSNLRRSVGDTAKIRRWPITGGAFYEKKFEEIPPIGAYLIGFHYSTSLDGKFPHVVQPIYMTPFGEALGVGYGIAGKNDTPKKTVKAKAGYAVGSIVVRGGGGFDAFKPVFMRISGTGLNPKDSYDGPHIGGMGGGEGTVGGDGGFIIGLHGKLHDRDGRMGAMSAISLSGDNPSKPTPKKKKP